MTSNQLQWVGVPRGRLPKIQMASVTRGRSAASEEVLPYLDDQLTRERQKTWVRRTGKPAEGALIKGGLESKKHESMLTSGGRNSEVEIPMPKKRLLSRLLSFGTSPLTKGLGRPVLPNSEPLSPLQDRQSEPKKSLSHGREHGSHVVGEPRTPCIGRKRDRQQEQRLFLPTVTHITKMQPLPIVSDYTGCSLADADFSNTLDGDAFGSGGIDHDPTYAPPRDPKGSPTMPQQVSITTNLLTKMPPILEADSRASTLQQISTAGRGRVGLFPSNEAQAGTRNASPLPINISLKKQSGDVCRSLPISAHPTTCLDEAIDQDALFYPGSREGFPRMNGLTESKRRSTYNWIQGLPENGGSIFDHWNPGRTSSTGQSLVPHPTQSTPEPLNTSLGAETAVPQLKPMHGCLTLASGKASRDSAGLISSQIKAGFGSVIGRPCILPPEEISAGGPSTPGGSATIRRIPSDPLSRAMLTVPGIPIAARYRMSKRAVWARAMASREVRERDQLLSRRAKMGWV
jgi:hypothetical protein